MYENTLQSVLELMYNSLFFFNVEKTKKKNLLLRKSAFARHIACDDRESIWNLLVNCVNEGVDLLLSVRKERNYPFPGELVLVHSFNSIEKIVSIKALK